MIKDQVIIPDSHSRPGISDRRFRWLNKYIKKHGVESVVHLGDHWDFPSMCTHDAHRSDFHQRSYENDCNKGFKDLALVLDGTGAEGDYLEGNHDERPKRFLASNKRFSGTLILPQDMMPVGWTWRGRSFRKGGVLFKHFEVSGNSGKPLSGENPAKTIINKTMCSTIVGHAHGVDIAVKTNGKGRKVIGIVAGCFLDPAQRERYAEDTQKLWVNGFWHLRNVHEG